MYKTLNFSNHKYTFEPDRTNANDKKQHLFVCIFLKYDISYSRSLNERML